MAIRKIPLSDGQRWVLEAGEEIRAAALRGLYSAGLRTQQYIVTDIIPQTDPRQPVDRGVYRAGWQVRKDSANSVLIFNDVPYASVIEYGMRPGFKVGKKMLDALVEWIVRKGITPHNAKVPTARKSKRGPKTFDEAAVRAMAWAIAQGMAKRGTKGLNVLGRAAPKIPTFVLEEIEAEIRKVDARGGAKP